MVNKVNLSQLWTGIVILIIAIIGLIVIYSGNPVKTNSIKIGIILPLTGADSDYGLNVKKGVELAKKDFGGDVELIYEDSKCNSDNAIASMNKFLSEGVSAVIGDLCDESTLSLAPIAEKNDIVLISPASTSSEVTN